MRNNGPMFIKLKVHPGSKEPAIQRKSPDAFEMWVRAPAENGRANHEALTSLAKALGCASSRLVIVKGANSPQKIVKVLGKAPL